MLERSQGKLGIGTVYHSQGEYEAAQPYHLNSLTIFEETGNRIGEARALNDLGVVYHHLGDDEHRRVSTWLEDVGLDCFLP